MKIEYRIQESIEYLKTKVTSFSPLSLGKGARVRLLFVLFIFFSLGLSAQEKLTILHTSDMHSRVEPVERKDDRDFDRGGLVRRVTFLKEFRKSNPDVLLFDSGDFSQGTPYYNMFRGEVELELMNEMKYDAMTIGNHEFDFGLENMARLFKMAKFPVVCANYDVDATVLKGLVEPYTIIKRDGVKIGVLGLGHPLEGMVQANKCEGIIYKDPVETANAVAAILKNKEKCDVVICLSHLGIQYDKTELIPNIRNIDVVLGGHSHTFMKTPMQLSDKDGKSVTLLHSGARGVSVGRMDLTLSKKK